VLVPPFPEPVLLPKVGPPELGLLFPELGPPFVLPEPRPPELGPSFVFPESRPPELGLPFVFSEPRPPFAFPKPDERPFPAGSPASPFTFPPLTTAGPLPALSVPGSFSALTGVFPFVGLLLVEKKGVMAVVVGVALAMPLGVRLIPESVVPVTPLLLLLLLASFRPSVVVGAEDCPDASPPPFPTPSSPNTGFCSLALPPPPPPPPPLAVLLGDASVVGDEKPVACASPGLIEMAVFLGDEWIVGVVGVL